MMFDYCGSVYSGSVLIGPLPNPQTNVESYVSSFGRPTLHSAHALVRSCNFSLHVIIIAQM